MISPVFYQFDRLIILDQTLLPGEEKYIYLETKEDVWQAIKKLQVFFLCEIYVILICKRNFEMMFRLCDNY